MENKVVVTRLPDQISRFSLNSFVKATDERLVFQLTFAFSRSPYIAPLSELRRFEVLPNQRDKLRLVDDTGGQLRAPSQKTAQRRRNRPRSFKPNRTVDGLESDHSMPPTTL